MLKRQILKDTSSLFSERLKKATNAISNSAPFSFFDYEKTVSNNIRTYFESVGEHQHVATNDLYLRVCQQGSLVKAYLYNKGQLLDEVPAKNLAACFMGALSSLGDESKVTQSVGRYLTRCSQQHQVSLKELSVLIRCNEDYITIMAYVQDKLNEKIPMTDLIKFFRS